MSPLLYVYAIGVAHVTSTVFYAIGVASVYRLA